MSEPRKTIVINPDFLKLPMRGNKTRKNNRDANSTPKPIKIRAEKKPETDKTIKRRALNYIRKQQEDRYKRLMKGLDADGAEGHRVETTDGKTYADEFKSGFDDSLAFLQKLTDQATEKKQVQNATLKQYPSVPLTNSTLFQAPILDKILDQNIGLDVPNVFQPTSTASSSFPMSTASFPMSTSSFGSTASFSLPKPTYGCLKGGSLPTYRTLKAQERGVFPVANNATPIASARGESFGGTTPTTQQIPQKTPRLTPEQQRAELKQFLEKRKEEKQRVERVKRQRNILKPSKKQKRTTTRTFRVGKSKHYPKVGVLIPNKTIRTQVLAKKQKMRETPLEDVRKYLIKKGLIRVGSSCPNDVLRQMYESSMMMCGEIQNHNPDNLLYNYLNNAI